MIREELLALADELYGMDCRTCPADGTKDCRDLPCEEAVARAAARRIREVVEHDGEGATTVSAHDLLSEDEREAIAWVREHGGLDAVEKRLMPEGMEWLLDVWPRWSNGEHCKFGDWWKAGEYGELEPQQLSMLAFFTPEKLREWGQDEGENFGYAWECMRPSDTTYRPDKVEPPAPKVLDADGVEIRVGDVLYSIETGDSVTVDSIEPGNPWFAKTDGELQHCAKFTHSAPVIAADGKPLEVGQTVWRDDGEMLEVLYLRPDGLVDCCGEIERPERLAHDRPVLDADGVPCREGDEVWEVRSHRRREIVGTHYRDYRTGEPLILCDSDDEIPIPATCVTHTKPEPPDTRALVIDGMDEETVERIDRLVKDGMWLDD